MLALVAQLDEVRALQRRLAEQHAVVGDDADRVAPDVGEAGDERRAVVPLELVEPAAVDESGDHLAHVVGRAVVGRDDAVELRRVDGRLVGLERPPTAAAAAGGSVATIERTICERVVVVVGEVVGHAGDARVQLAAAEVLGGHDLAGRGLHQRRAAEEDRALVAHDHRLVAHRRHVRAAGGARAEHRGDLGDARADICAWL